MESEVRLTLLLEGTNAPVPDCLIKFWSQGEVVNSGRTDDEGVLEVTLPAPASYGVSVQWHAMPPDFIDPLELPAESSHSATLLHPAPIGARFRVVGLDGEGREAVGLRIAISPEGRNVSDVPPALGLEGRAISGGEGRFTFPVDPRVGQPLVSGPEGTLLAFTNDGPWLPSLDFSRRPVDVSGETTIVLNESVNDGEIVLVRPPALRPNEAYRIDVVRDGIPAQTATGVAPTFPFRFLPGARYRISAGVERARQFAQQAETTFTAPDQSPARAEVVFPDRVEISGFVLVGDFPAAGFQVAATTAAPGGLMRTLDVSGYTQSDGAWSVEVPPADAYTFEVINPPPTNPGRAARTLSRAEAERTPITFNFPAADLLNGVVVDASGNPVPGAVVRLVSEAGELLGGDTTSDHTGRFIQAMPGAAKADAPVFLLARAPDGAAGVVLYEPAPIDTLLSVRVMPTARLRVHSTPDGIALELRSNDADPGLRLSSLEVLNRLGFRAVQEESGVLDVSHLPIGVTRYTPPGEDATRILTGDVVDATAAGS